jgi:indolepyruvate ferredoxin oxidoreductase
VARLYTDGSFQRQLANEFESHARLEFHLAPPILGRVGADGKPRKSSFGPWMMMGFRILARLKGLRGTAFDVFGKTAERKRERQLLREYEADLDLIDRQLAASNHEAAVALAAIPSLVRGFGHVREASMQRAAGERVRVLERLKDRATAGRLQAAE